MIPDIEGENDTSYFEEYDDEDEHVEHVRTLLSHLPQAEAPPCPGFAAACHAITTSVHVCG